MKIKHLETNILDLKRLEQKVLGELFDNSKRDYSCSDDFQDGYERALRLVIQWIETP